MARAPSLTDRTFRVIAQGDDAVGSGFTLAEALAALDDLRAKGGRHVAIVDGGGVLVDEGDARRWVARG